MKLKKITSSILFIGLILTATSCKKEIEVCVDGDWNPSEVGTYKYTWCGQNADQIIWKIVGGSYTATQTFITQEGQPLEISVDLLKKGQYNLSILAENKKKDAGMSYTINVGSYSPRVELFDCSGLDNYYGDFSLNFKAYAYASVTDLQNDLRNYNTANCLDSVALDKSTYYNNENHTVGSEVLVGGFNNLANGTYYVYVKSEDNTLNNLSEMVYYPGLLYVDKPVESEGVYYNGYDPIVNPKIADANLSTFTNNLFTKTFLLTAVTINGTPQTVSACNADDFITFNLDKTWTLDVGADNCSGNQTTSVGTFNDVNTCNVNGFSNVIMTANSGSLSATTYLNFSYVSNTEILVKSGDGTNNIEQTFTAQ